MLFQQTELEYLFLSEAAQSSLAETTSACRSGSGVPASTLAPDAEMR
jgi:hypothetical protein